MANLHNSWSMYVNTGLWQLNKIVLIIMLNIAIGSTKLMDQVFERRCGTLVPNLFILIKLNIRLKEKKAF